MKYKPGDKVRVVIKDSGWIYWCPIMNTTIGKTYIIHGEYELGGRIHPTIIIPGGDNDLSRKLEEYSIPEHCLEKVYLPGEQLLFAFMTTTN